MYDNRLEEALQQSSQLAPTTCRLCCELCVDEYGRDTTRSLTGVEWIRARDWDSDNCTFIGLDDGGPNQIARMPLGVKGEVFFYLVVD